MTKGYSHVALMVWAVKVLAIPASREGDGGADATRADLLRERCRILTRAWGTAEWSLFNVVLASVADLLLHTPLRAQVRVADQHAETLFATGM